MTGADPRWFSWKDIFAGIAVLALGIAYFLGAGTRDWIATAIFMMLAFWIISKIEHAYLSRRDKKTGAQEGAASETRSHLDVQDGAD